MREKRNHAPKQPTGCPAWILEGVRKKREEATGKTRPNRRINHDTNVT